MKDCAEDIFPAPGISFLIKGFFTLLTFKPSPDPTLKPSHGRTSG